MNSKIKRTIISFLAGASITVLYLFTNDTPLNIKISAVDISWTQLFIMYLFTIISVPLFIAFINALPERTINPKHIFNANYFYLISIFILGVGVTSAPYLFINDYNLASISFYFCFGISIFIGSLIANKLFGGLS